MFSLGCLGPTGFCFWALLAIPSPSPIIRVSFTGKDSAFVSYGLAFALDHLWIAFHLWVPWCLDEHLTPFL